MCLSNRGKTVTPYTYSAGHLHLQQRLEVLLKRAELQGLFPLIRLWFQRAPAVQEHKELTPTPQHANGADSERGDDSQRKLIH